jgi:hypothetical protein
MNFGLRRGGFHGLPQGLLEDAEPLLDLFRGDDKGRDPADDVVVGSTGEQEQVPAEASVLNRLGHSSVRLAVSGKLHAYHTAPHGLRAAGRKEERVRGAGDDGEQLLCQLREGAVDDDADWPWRRRAACSWTAATILGWRWPVLVTPIPLVKSKWRRPSML